MKKCGKSGLAALNFGLFLRFPVLDIISISLPISLWNSKILIRSSAVSSSGKMASNPRVSRCARFVACEVNNE
ncbi:hypothetical protein SDJN03_04064, partial [Cucurbita argyrosperma subsp. sororia]